MRRYIALALMLIVQSAASRCIDAHYEITGTVLDASGAPIAGAEVVAMWQDFIAPRRQKVLSRADGSFSVMVIYTPFSGSTSQGLDRCEGKLAQIKVSSSKAGFGEAAIEIEPSSENPSANFVLKKQASGPAANKTMEPTR